MKYEDFNLLTRQGMKHVGKKAESRPSRSEASRYGGLYCNSERNFRESHPKFVDSLNRKQEHERRIKRGNVNRHTKPKRHCNRSRKVPGHADHKSVKNCRDIMVKEKFEAFSKLIDTHLRGLRPSTNHQLHRGRPAHNKKHIKKSKNSISTESKSFGRTQTNETNTSSKSSLFRGRSFLA